MRIKTLLLVALGLGIWACGAGDEKSSEEDAKQENEKEEEEGDKEPPVVGNKDFQGASLSEVEINSSSSSIVQPRALFNGTNYAVIWDHEEGNKISFQKVDTDGNAVGSASEVYTASGSTTVVSDGRMDFAHAGGAYLTAFQSSGVMAGIFDDDGEIVSDFEVVTSTSGFPSVASNGTDFGLAYTTNRASSSPSEIKFRTVGADGTVGDEVTVSDSEYAFQPQVVWNSKSELYAVVWEQQDGSRSKPYEVYFATLNSDGSVATSAKRVTPDDNFISRMPVVEPYGKGFALLFRDSRNMKLGEHPEISEITQVRLSILSKTGDITDITGDGKVDANDEYLISNPYIELAKLSDLVVSDNDEIGIVWSAQEEPYTIYFSQAKMKSGSMTHTIRSTLVDEDETALRPQVVSSGASEYFAVWKDTRGVYGAK